MKPVSKEEFLAILERQQKSGLSIKDFCANESYTVSMVDGYRNELDLYKRVLTQKRQDKSKIYSLHEVDVQCISKGKEHKLYEFGNNGKGRALDNVWIERFWHTLKQEYVYICPAGNGNMLRKGLTKFITYYNNRRQHQSLDRKTPFSWYEYAA